MSSEKQGTPCPGLEGEVDMFRILVANGLCHHLATPEQRKVFASLCSEARSISRAMVTEATVRVTLQELANAPGTHISRAEALGIFHKQLPNLNRLHIAVRTQAALVGLNYISSVVAFCKAYSDAAGKLANVTHCTLEAQSALQLVLLHQVLRAIAPGLRSLHLLKDSPWESAITHIGLDNLLQVLPQAWPNLQTLLSNEPRALQNAQPYRPPTVPLPSWGLKVLILPQATLGAPALHMLSDRLPQLEVLSVKQLTASALRDVVFHGRNVFLRALNTLCLNGCPYQDEGKEAGVPTSWEPHTDSGKLEAVCGLDLPNLLQVAPALRSLRGVAVNAFQCETSAMASLLQRLSGTSSCSSSSTSNTGSSTEVPSTCGRGCAAGASAGTINLASFWSLLIAAVPQSVVSLYESVSSPTTPSTPSSEGSDATPAQHASAMTDVWAASSTAPANHSPSTAGLPNTPTQQLPQQQRAQGAAAPAAGGSSVQQASAALRADLPLLPMVQNVELRVRTMAQLAPYLNVLAGMTPNVQRLLLRAQVTTFLADTSDQRLQPGVVDALLAVLPRLPRLRAIWVAASSSGDDVYDEEELCEQAVRLARALAAAAAAVHNTTSGNGSGDSGGSGGGGKGSSGGGAALRLYVRGLGRELAERCNETLTAKAGGSDNACSRSSACGSSNADSGAASMAPSSCMSCTPTVIIMPWECPAALSRRWRDGSDDGWGDGWSDDGDGGGDDDEDLPALVAVTDDDDDPWHGDGADLEDLPMPALVLDGDGVGGGVGGGVGDGVGDGVGGDVCDDEDELPALLADDGDHDDDGDDGNGSNAGGKGGGPHPLLPPGPSHGGDNSHASNSAGTTDAAVAAAFTRVLAVSGEHNPRRRLLFVADGAALQASGDAQRAQGASPPPASSGTRVAGNPELFDMPGLLPDSDSEDDGNARGQ